MLAMAPLFLWPVLFVTLPVLVWLLDGTGEASIEPWCALVAAIPCNPGCRRHRVVVGLWLLPPGQFWIGEAFLVEAEIFAWLLPFAVTLLPAGLALFPAAALGAARAAWRPGFARVLVLAIALSLAEWLRGHILTGFPWNVLGYALTSPLALMQAAGARGHLWPHTLHRRHSDRPVGRFRRYARGSGEVDRRSHFCRCCWQFWRPMALQSFWPSPPATFLALSCASYSPAFLSAINGAGKSSAKFLTTISTLSRRNAAGEIDNLIGVTHVVWPEAAMPFLPLASPEALDAIGELLGQKTQLITGALRVEQVAGTSEGSRPARRIFNSLMVFGQGGQLDGNLRQDPSRAIRRIFAHAAAARSDRARAAHAHPGWLRHRGDAPAAFNVSGCHRCWVSSATRPFFRARSSRVETGPASSSTSRTTAGSATRPVPWQHLHQTRVRAVEEGIPIIRAANNGDLGGD